MGPLLLPILALLLVTILIASFALIYLPRYPDHFHAPGGIPAWREVLYFSGVTLLTIGYGDVAPRGGIVQILALMEGISGLAILSLFTAYLLTVNEAVQRKRSAALTLYHQARKGADVPALLAHHYRRGRFYGLEDLLRKGADNAQATMETHIEHPVIHFYHSAAVYKSFPRFLFVLLELTSIVESLLDCDACCEIVDHPDLTTLRESVLTVVKELLSVLNLENELEVKAGPPCASKRHQICFERAEATLAAKGIPLANRRTAFNNYRASRREWEHGLFVLARFLGYDWSELTGDEDLETAHEDESSEVHLEVDAV